jgi:hypothetical protein
VRLDWAFIAKLVAGFVVAICVGAAISSGPTVSSVPVSLDPEFDGKPLDFADPMARRAMLSHDAEMRRSKLASVAERCDRGEEIYRAQSIPGLESGDFRIVEGHLTGSQANVVVFRFGNVSTSARNDDYVWHRTFEVAIDATQLIPVRDALSAVLKIGALPAIGDKIVDAPRVIVETCRRGRYHFFDRALPGADSAETETRVGELAQAVLHLADRSADRTK